MSLKRNEKKRALSNLPNIGAEMVRCLLEAGISSPEELKRIGSIEAAIRISPHRRSGPACKSALCALEGAIRGVRWHYLPEAERDDLWKEYQRRQI